jgi:hypothetical protein
MGLKLGQKLVHSEIKRNVCLCNQLALHYRIEFLKHLLVFMLGVWILGILFNNLTQLSSLTG